MPATSCSVRSAFALLRSGTALEVAYIVASSGPIGWPGVQSRLSGCRRVSDRSIRHALMRLYHLELTDRRPGRGGLLVYRALPALRRLLRVMDVSASSFISLVKPNAPPGDSCWEPDTPDSLGL